MSKKHPIISVTGSSGAGTTTIKNTFDQIFRREGLRAVSIEGDAFHRYDRAEMKSELARRTEAGDHTFSHFSIEANELAELEQVFRSYGDTGTGRTRHYVHDDREAEKYGTPPGQFTEWAAFQPESDLLFYEGLHGAVKTDGIDIAGQADLKIGVVPVINVEWIQKIHRDKASRGYSTEAVTDVILRRMHDYVHVITPVHPDRHQFPAGAGGRHLESVHRALDPDPGRKPGGDPLSQSARHRFSLSDPDDRRLVDEPRQFHRHSGAADGPGHAVDPDPDGDADGQRIETRLKGERSR